MNRKAVSFVVTKSDALFVVGGSQLSKSRDFVETWRWHACCPGRTAKASDLVSQELGGAMIIDTKIESTRKLSGESGVGIPELLIVVAIVAIISAVALINFRSAGATLRLQNSVRQLASYMEKARIDAVRRHSTTEVKFTSPTSYTVTMDFLTMECLPLAVLTLRQALKSLITLVFPPYFLIGVGARSPLAPLV